ncbi:MAG: methylated-DNA--[protein]-cysteine S-methyltransferase [Neisseriaceae bacterium]
MHSFPFTRRQMLAQYLDRLIDKLNRTISGIHSARNTLYLTYFPTPLGFYCGGAIEDKIAFLTSFHCPDLYTTLLKLAKTHSTNLQIKRTATLSELIQQLQAYFDQRLITFDLPIVTRGTYFQEKVWAVLREVPYGDTITYKEEALRLNQPSAARAVGRANALNPITILVPCHRVISNKKTLLGYSSGLRIKKKLLQLEGVRIQK